MVWTFIWASSETTQRYPIQRCAFLSTDTCILRRNVVIRVITVRDIIISTILFDVFIRASGGQHHGNFAFYLFLSCFLLPKICISFLSTYLLPTTAHAQFPMSRIMEEQIRNYLSFALKVILQIKLQTLFC